MSSRHKPRKTKEERQKNRQTAQESLKNLQNRVDAFEDDESTTFDALPLSQPTLQGLKSSHFSQLTDIQRRAIPLSLKGKDVLGAARTGSGKTLAFLIPLLELLYRSNWSQADGLGGLVISPTRELALQIFEVLRKIGRHHGFSAGLVIGGKDLKEEADRMLKMNILVCTPGRLLQHMDQTAGFQADNLQILVLDEADRILDMGFRKTIDAIVDNLPSSRQTLLFSATQTKSVKDLARLSLKDAEYVAVHQAAESATPASLQQSYVLLNLPEKLDTLFGFMKTHLKCKAIVFFSTGKQVRFAYETFRHLHPGVPLIHLHGKQKQTSRAEITTRFSNSQHCYLFCTDIVARGLDFPAVDWVVQVDCPEDADTYIHRVGRTARYEKGGKALLMLLPSEEGAFLARLHKKKVEVAKITIKSSKKQTIIPQLQHMCFKDPEIKYLGQKAFVSYIRSINLHHDKDVFKAEALPSEEFAASLGLPGAPRIKFVSAKEVKAKKNAVLKPDADDSESSSASELVPDKKTTRTKYDRMFERRNQDILTDHYIKLIDQEQPDTNINDTADADNDDDFMTMKRKDHALNEETKPIITIDSKRKQKEALSKKAMLKYKPKGEKVLFDDDGQQHSVYELQSEAEFRAAGASETQIAQFLASQRANMGNMDINDKSEARDKKREKKRIKLEKQRAREHLSSGESEDETPKRKWFQRSPDPGPPLSTLDEHERLALEILGKS